MKYQRWFIGFKLAFALFIISGSFCYLPMNIEAQPVLRIAAPEGAPSDFMAELVAQYATENGVQVEVAQYPWTEYPSVVEGIWANHSDLFDLIIGDSQWIGTAASRGHYVDLTDFVKSVKDRFTDQSIAYFSEYPKGSGRYYGILWEGDALGFAYRKDLFENPTEMAAFKAQYGRELIIPTTWSEFRDIAEFFTRPASNLYGAAMMYSSQYDYITMIFQPILWSFGGDWSNSSNLVEGVVNSPESVKALTFLINLLPFNPPNALNFTQEETEMSFIKGESVLCQDWFSFMPILNSDSNPYKDKTGYFIIPGENQHFISLGGQGISLSTYSNNKEAAMSFLQWFVKDEVQLKWAQLGGLSSSKSVIASTDFLQAEPFNDAYIQTMPFVKDFYNVPSYADLLAVTQTNLYAAAKGTLSPQAALDIIAQKHTRILSRNSNAMGWELY